MPNFQTMDILLFSIPLSIKLDMHRGITISKITSMPEKKMAAKELFLYSLKLPANVFNMGYPPLRYLSFHKWFVIKK